MRTRSSRRTFVRNTAVGALGLALLQDSHLGRAHAADAAPGDWSWWPGPTPPEVRDALIKQPWGFPDEQQRKQIEAAAPDNAPAAPQKPRKLLVWGRLWTHPGNATCQEAMKIIARKSGAFEVVASDDPRLLLPESLKGFDAIFWLGLHDPEPFMPLNWKERPAEELAKERKLDAAVKQSVIDFVTEDGKGIAGIEGSICALAGWPAFGQMMGATYGGHYVDDLVIRVEDPTHPVVACFEGKPFRISTQGYIPRAPYSREALRVLLSLDLTQMANPAKAAWQKENADKVNNDFPISWVRECGQGRVFYVSLGVWPKEYANPILLRHLLAGTQFALGDLKGSTTPSGRRTP